MSLFWNGQTSFLIGVTSYRNMTDTVARKCYSGKGSILFTNDLVPELPNGIHAGLYADDLVLWCTEEYATTATHRVKLAPDR